MTAVIGIIIGLCFIGWTYLVARIAYALGKDH